MRDVLSAELEAALLRELAKCYHYENAVRFDGKLAPAVMALVDSDTHLGRYVSRGRRIEMARSFILDRPWIEVMSVLQHEMAHQFVHEVCRVHDEPPHGDTFQRVCAERGVDARAAGTPVTDGAGEPDDDDERVLERIRKLLALAGSDNQHEAELAMRKAHELMLRHNVEAAATTQSYTLRQLGDPEKRGNRVESAILGLLAELFFVKVIIIPVYLPHLGRNGKAYELSGTRANVDMAEHVYHFLRATADRLWNQNRSDRRVRSGRDRLAYQAGVVLGFRDKLVAERTTLRGTGLVWVGDGDLERFYRSRHRRITTRRSAARYTAALAAGREAGRTVVLHRPVTASSSPGTGPRLLR